MRLLCSWDFPGKNTGGGCHFLLQGIFPTQGSNSHLCPGLAGGFLTTGKYLHIYIYVKSACSGGDPGLIPGPGRSPGEGHGYPLQYSCLVNDKSQTCLSDRHTRARVLSRLVGCRSLRTESTLLPFQCALVIKNLLGNIILLLPTCNSITQKEKENPAEGRGIQWHAGSQ